MNQYNNKDLYQIIGINENASQQEIDNLALIKSSKDNPEVGQALMILSDFQKRKEYDRVGWKDEWNSEWEKENAFRNSIFEAIQNYKHHWQNTKEYTPDGHQVGVIAEIDLDPNLWAPFQGQAHGWVKKIWGTYGENWKQQLKDFKNKMLNALDEAWERNKKTPLLDIWEAVEGGNCAKCGKTARIRWKNWDRHSDKIYCSRDCALDDTKIDYELPKYKKQKDYICAGCRQQDKNVYEMAEGKYYHKSCFDKKSEKNEKDNGYCVYCQKKNGQETWNWDNTNTGKYEKYCSHACREKASAEYCDNCQKQIEKRREGHKEIYQGIRSVDSNHQWRVFCSENCQKKWQQKPGNELGITKLTKLGEFLAKKRGESAEYAYNRLTGKTTKKVKNNPLHELLKWMKKEGIVNISLNANGNLVIEYSSSQSRVINDNNLTSEQKEIKEFFQQLKAQGGQTYLSQKELEAAASEGTNHNQTDKNNFLVPVTIIGLGAIIIVLIGVIIYKNKKKNY